jgi:hypothetical protein
VIDIIHRSIIPEALRLLPSEMTSPAAHAMLLSIGLQESRFLFRRQQNFGPARGFWQFEKAGVRGVMRHKETKAPLEAVLKRLRYESAIGKTADLHYAVADNDVLACVFARLLLWTVPGQLPDEDDPGSGWAQYLEGWRPGAPHPETWDNLFKEAWTRVTVGAS